MQAVTSIDPRLIKMLGRKLYAQRPLPILLRELRQNAEDACKRAGVKPDIRITVFKKFGKFLVICDDNGDGMSPEDIVNKFLCLGGRKADQLGQTGGFGIAKAAIMSHDHWDVWTRSNYISSRTLLEGGEIETRESRQGTRIRVLVEDSLMYGDMRQSFMNIFFSDLSVTFRWNHKILENAGMDGLKYGKAKLFHEDDFVKCTGVDEVELPLGIQVRGADIFRLNGMVQFSNVPYSSDREINLIFDIKTDKSPEDDEYPFSMSREELSSDFKRKVTPLIESHNANILQSKRMLIEETPPEEETFHVLDGHTIQGQRTTRHREDKVYHGSMGNRIESGSTKLERERGSSGMPLLILYYFKKDPGKAVWYAKLLKAWSEVLRITAGEDEEFGIGISTERSDRASRLQIDGNLFYILNPTCIPAGLSDEGIVHYLWLRAIHETSHRFVNNHNELFSSTMGSIGNETIERLLQEKGRIMKILQ